MSTLSESVCRKSWETQRSKLRLSLIEKKFNPQKIEDVIDNFIESMSFARIPCHDKEGIAAAYRQFKSECQDCGIEEGDEQ